MSGPLLVFGAAGQVGRELMALAAARGIAAIGITRAEGDIADATAVGSLVEAHNPSLIVNAAAYTAVDKAESERDKATAGNVDGPDILAKAAAAAGVPILHISTDYVFDGTKIDAYDEHDPIAPLGVYGQTKADGEARVRAATPRHVILRTAWVYGTYGNNFLKTMLRLADERDQLRVVGDQYGCPTSTRDIAEAILAVQRKLTDGGTVYGTYHFAGSGDTSWHGFADAVVQAQAPRTGKHPPVTAIATSDYPTPAKRPANSRLNSTRFAETFGYRALPWRERVAETVADVLAATV